jgi:23S rRNA pseudouridine2605 synthase
VTESSNPSPSADQLLAARAAHWHQNAAPLLTTESLRAWLNTAGLVLYTPHPQQSPSPAPRFVEAILGTVSASPSLAEIDTARNLLARLIAEGSALPLNLLGVTGGTGTDVPDFVVSAAVFSYIFTLRGNKPWKLPPVTAGPVKVSPLALATYEALVEHASLSAYDLTTHLGKEVTEAAVLRSLTELWTQLRVIPVPQQNGAPTLWELTSLRFTKQIKSGANAARHRRRD